MSKYKSIKDLVDEAYRVLKRNGLDESLYLFEDAVIKKKSQYLWKAYANFAKKFCEQDQVIKIYEKAHREFSDKVIIIRDYANYLYEIGEYDDALKLYKKGKQLFPKQKTQFNLAVGNIYIKRKEYKLAKEEFEKILRRSPNNSQAWKKIAEIEGKIALLYLKDNKVSNDTIERSIEFPAKYYQSGLSILSYFNTILNQKYPNIDVNVTIKQENMTVKMIVESSDGTREIIEKTLYEYALVVAGKMKSSELLSNQYQVLALENKLELAKMELNLTNKLLESERTKNDEKISYLESEISKLHELVSIGLSQKNHLLNIVENYLSTNDESLFTSLKLIEKLSLNGATKNDKQDLIEALETIRVKKPSVLNNISELIINGAISGASGNMLYSWIIAFCNSMPK